MFGSKVFEVLYLVQILFFIPPSSQGSDKIQERKFCFFASSELIYENVMKQVAPSAVCEGGGRLLDNKVSLGGVQGVVDDFDSLWGAVYFIDEIDYPSILRYAQSRSQLSFMSQARIALPKVQIPAICRTVDLGIISSGFPFSSKNEVAFETTVSQYIERMKQLGAPEKYLRKMNTAQKWVPASFANSASQSNGQNSMRRRVTLKTMNQKSSKRFTSYPTTPYPSADDIGAPEQEQPLRSKTPSTPTTNHVAVETIKQDIGNSEQRMTQIVTQKQTPGMPPLQQITTISNDESAMRIPQNVPGSVGDPIQLVCENPIQRPYGKNPLRPEDSLPQIIPPSKSYPTQGAPEIPTEILDEKLGGPNDRMLSLPQNTPVRPLDSPSEIPVSPKSHPLQETPPRILERNLSNPRDAETLSRQNPPQLPSTVVGDSPENMPLNADERSDQPMIPRRKKPFSQKPLQHTPGTYDDSIPQFVNAEDIQTPLQKSPVETLEEAKNHHLSKPLLLQNSSPEPSHKNLRRPFATLPNNDDETSSQPLVPTQMKPEELSPPLRALQNNAEPLKEKLVESPQAVFTPESELPNETPSQLHKIPKEKSGEVCSPQASRLSPQQSSRTELPRKNSLKPEDTLINNSSQEFDDEPTKPQVSSPISPSTIQDKPGLLDKKLENPSPLLDNPQKILKQGNISPDTHPISFQDIPEEILSEESSLKPLPEQNRPTELLSLRSTQPEDTLQATLPTKKPLSQPVHRRNVPKEVVEKEIRNRRGSKLMYSQSQALESQNKPQDKLATKEVERQPIVSIDGIMPPQYTPELTDRKREIPMSESPMSVDIKPKDKLSNRLLEPLQDTSEITQEDNQIPKLSKPNKLENTLLDNIPNQERLQQTSDTTPQEVDNLQVPKTSPLRGRPSDLQSQDLNKHQGIQPEETYDKKMTPSAEITPTYKEVGQSSSKSSGNAPKILEIEETLLPHEDSSQKFTKPNKNPTPLQNTPKDLFRDRDLNLQDFNEPVPQQDGPTKECSPISSESENMLPKEQITNPIMKPLSKKQRQFSPKPLMHTPNPQEDELQNPTLLQEKPKELTNLDTSPTPLQNSSEELQDDTPSIPQNFKPLPLQNRQVEQDNQISQKPDSVLPTEQVSNPTMIPLLKKSPQFPAYTPDTLDPLQSQPKECTKSNTPTSLENIPLNHSGGKTYNPQDFKPLPLQKSPTEHCSQTPQISEDMLPHEQISNQETIPSRKKSPQFLSKAPTLQGSPDETLENPMPQKSNPQKCKTPNMTPLHQNTSTEVLDNEKRNPRDLKPLPLLNGPTEQFSQISSKTDDMLPKDQISDPATKLEPKNLGQVSPKPLVHTPNPLEDKLQNPTQLQENPQELTKSNVSPTLLQNALEELEDDTSSTPQDSTPLPLQKRVKEQHIQVSKKSEDLQSKEQISNPIMTPPSNSSGQPPACTSDTSEKKMENPTPFQDNPRGSKKSKTPTSLENIPPELSDGKNYNPQDFKPVPLESSPTEHSCQPPQILKDMLPDEQSSNPEMVTLLKKSPQLLSKAPTLQGSPDETLENPVMPLHDSSPELLKPKGTSSGIPGQEKPRVSLEETPQSDSNEILERKLEEKTQKAALDLHKTIKEVLLSSPSTSSQPSSVTAVSSDDGNAPTTVRSASKNLQSNPASPTIPNALTLDIEAKSVDKLRNRELLDKNAAPHLNSLNSEMRSLATYSEQTESKQTTNKEMETIKIGKPHEADALEPSTTEECSQAQTRTCTNTNQEIQETERLTSSKSVSQSPKTLSEESNRVLNQASNTEASSQSQASKEPASGSPDDDTKLIPGFTLGSIVPEFDILSKPIEPTFLKAGSAVSQAKSIASAEPQQTRAKSTASVGPQQSQTKITASAGPQQTQSRSIASAGTQKPCLSDSPAQVTSASASRSSCYANPTQTTSTSTPNTIPGKVTKTPISTPDATGINIQTEHPNGISSTTQLVSRDGSNKVATMSVSSSNGSPSSGTKLVGIRSEGAPGSSVSSSSAVSVVN